MNRFTKIKTVMSSRDISSIRKKGYLGLEIFLIIIAMLFFIDVAFREDKNLITENLFVFANLFGFYVILLLILSVFTYKENVPVYFWNTAMFIVYISVSLVIMLINTLAC